MYVKHDDASDMKVSKFPRTPTKIYVGKHADRAPTKVSVPPIRFRGAQSGMGVEYEDTEYEHGDTDEETVGDLEQSEQSNTDEEMVDSEHEEHNHNDNENIGNVNEDTDSEYKK